MGGVSAHTFSCLGDELLGILHKPSNQPKSVGVLVVVGGPQYRVGSHRMFVRLARRLAAGGYPVFRFDYRGMGDSDGAQKTFDSVDADIGTAVDAFLSLSPSIDSVVIFGLCDGASAASIYAPSDGRVSGLVLLNPWVRSTSGVSRARLWYYYPRRLIDGAMWRKMASGKFEFRRSIKGVMTTLHSTIFGQVTPDAVEKTYARDPGFIDRMKQGLQNFSGAVLIVLSGNDLTAQEFNSLTRRDDSWSAVTIGESVKTVSIRGADHTLSEIEAFGEFVQSMLEWLDLRINNDDTHQ